jgi:glycosyltransferase involved in cell wall biosynthesis
VNSISVIVRTQNRPIMLVRALASLAAQTRRPDEVVVVNESAAVEPVRAAVKAAEEHLKIVVLEHASPKGRGGALNAGIKAASGEWLGILDDDDTWEPEFVEAMMGRLDEAPGTSAVACQTLVIVEKMDRRGRAHELDRGVLNPDFCAVDLAALAAWNQFTINAIVFSRAAWQGAGTFREDLPVLEDWEFNVRLALRNEIAVITRPLAHYRRRPAATESSANTMEREHEIVRRRLINEWLREDLRVERFGLGHLAVQSLVRRDIQRIHPLAAVYERLRRRWHRLRGRLL